MTGAPTLVLLHGLGATPGVWHDLGRCLDWPGPVASPALAGHAGAPWTGDYTVGALAGSVSAALDPVGPTVVVGHSLGGAVALALASGWYRPQVLAVLGLGVKVVWADGDVAGMAKVAERGIRWFDSRRDAIERFMLQAGLTGLIGADHPATADAVVEQDGRWRVAQDPASFAQRVLDTTGLLGAARCPVVLGAGEHDAMSGAADLARFVPEPVIAPGRGHNVQVEDPGWVADQIRAAGAAVGIKPL